MEQLERGLYKKFRVERIDRRHSDCSYFVIDLDCDPHAAAAITAYAISCRQEGYESLSSDLTCVVDELIADGYVSIFEDKVKALTKEGRELLDEFREIEENRGCSCPISPPCSYCTHPGNPTCLEESPELWVTVSVK